MSTTPFANLVSNNQTQTTTTNNTLRARVRSFVKCPRCNQKTTPTLAINNAASENWLECTNPNCNTYINTFVPQGYQQAVHTDPHRYIGNFGGYGSGKTTTSRQELYKHIFLTPNGNSLVGANVTSQYEQTIKRDIEADFPKAFVKHVNTQKAYIDFINGHRLMFRPFDDVNKLRSYNIDFFIILEASECKMDAFTQLQSRLRNLAATTPKLDPQTKLPLYDQTPEGVLIPQIEADWRKGLIESNPDAGWIRNGVLYKSDQVYKHGDVLDQIASRPTKDPTKLDEESEEDEINPAMSSHIAASNVNKFLPPTFLQDLAKSKPAWWIKRMIYGSFAYAEGLVYPAAQNYIVPSASLPEVPKHWPRIIAFDYGLRDDSVFLFGAIDVIHNLLFIYKEIRTNNKNIKELAHLYHDAIRDIPSGALLMPPIIDPKSGPKRDYDKKTLSDHFLEHGIAFMPGQISIDARIYRLNTYLESGRIRIVDCCYGLIKELAEYKFIPKSLDPTVYVADKPEDKNNHGINPLKLAA